MTKNQQKNDIQLAVSQSLNLIPEAERRTALVEKMDLHQRNKHRGRYDFDQLIAACPALANFVKLNAYGDASIDFAHTQAVKVLNQALLKLFYRISAWDIPAQYLCPPIPGRADYLHYIADLLTGTNGGVTQQAESIRVLDIGVGANIIYPLIGSREYGWNFVGSDIDPIALANAQHIIDSNDKLSSAIELRLQRSPLAVFNGVLQQNETFDITMCNPPFHGSLAEAQAGTQRKWQNLSKRSGKGLAQRHASTKSAALNFGGQSAELYCAGGEVMFIDRMVSESKQIATQCLWFTSLVSKASSLPSIYRALKKVGALEVKTINMAQGQKKSRMVAWTFLNASQQRNWMASKK
ncbi:MAG: 23S rRNA (adenine(1618)-N(6))-methyltransferase RlmF [Methylotenera sp.]|nr:23S rRNA (adenine(1618)-N(6))-methyltransferase RlmF [Methylotenera sp.]MSP99122.1 23S rRNA (adenine(1618)-N(6))-methyltransferase RlmF [Methylotenera sp.]